MVFTPDSWLPPLPEIPDVSLPAFMFDEQYGRAPFSTSLDPYVCSVSGKTITPVEQKERIETLARSLSSELRWAVNEGSEMDKVVGIFALNTIDIPTLHWAVHRLNGIIAAVNATYTVYELAPLLKEAKAKALFTVLDLVETAKLAAEMCGIPSNNIYILDMPGDEVSGESLGYTTMSRLLRRGQDIPELEAARWSPGQSAKQVAYLSHSSGTSGPPKLAAVSHRNIIANIMQVNLFELRGRGGPDARQVALGLLPSSHVYGLVIISHLSTYRGDSVIILPKFQMERMLESVEKYHINIFSVVPPIIVALGKSPHSLRRHDLSSIQTVLSGGAPLDTETLNRLNEHYPHWVFRQGYGLTEAGAAISLTSTHEPWAGSAGNLVPGVKVKLLAEDGAEVTQYDRPGEVYAQGPGVILGYWGNPTATKESFLECEDGRWLRTGDIAVFRQAPSGTEHIFIVDRVKEVIKVKGLQVVPAELEACLLTHPEVADCAVIGIPDERVGEIPKAYIQRSTTIGAELSAESLAHELTQLVQTQKARHKWLAGGIQFVNMIPRSPSGKTLRRLIRDLETQTKKAMASKL
ncbi:uncharacterized protein A1O5_05202 [Cladophialophora psammophila CBS 110553]|uniref:Uncharacterized protein n=1 Tax=Cladophialophora psammophila CBS 110553 TaxID=1182543 RepID=W9X270_9EURO|nr:uncharacterized protein A1O5_05202 [Cladophialophora psammophila CBS 110553]EXJ71395.1 hypothetical protein A1O5_05202 [Cladophialophora psammophila CBS 110553]